MATTSLPQILTRSVVPSLIADLDASDVLECYSLTRNAVLYGFNNATIQKMAIGIRYYPPDSSRKQPLELTLEYGPQRMGSLLEEESMPMILLDDHLSWENEGRVYFTTASIQSYQWKSAYYMASLTGAVLNKLLEKAVIYATLRPRYQPFIIVDDETKELVLKSSSSTDFVFQMWDELAELGVDLRPILTPPAYQPRLYSRGKVEKVSGYDSTGKFVPAEAAKFFSHFSACWHAIATGDYSAFQTPAPSLTPSIPSTDVPSISPSIRTSSPITETPIANPITTEAPVAPKQDLARGKTDGGEVSDGNTTMTGTTNGAHNDGEAAEDSVGDDSIQGDDNSTDGSAASKNNSADDDGLDDDDDDDDNGGAVRYLSQVYNRISDRVLGVIQKPPQQQQLTETHDDNDDSDDVFLAELEHLTTNNSSNNVSMPSMAPTIADTTSEAQKAAHEAKEAAQAAKNASSHESAEKAADAAEHAADAAQHAADAALWEKDMASLRSGDGTLVTQAIQQCWTDPRYGMLSQNDSTVLAYIYVDGNFYYRLNMTTPFVDVLTLPADVPQALRQSSVTVDDFVDWTLAFCIMALAIGGVFLLLQQLGIKLAFYNYQKWFFHPTGPKVDDTEDDVMGSNHSPRGRGQAHGMAEDAIPLSMGGRRLRIHKSNLLVTNSPNHPRRSRDLECTGVELTNMTFPHISETSSEDEEEDAPATQIPPLRFTRHPDLVDMPGLSSRSKVAKPVTMNSLSDHSGHGGGDY